jgi:hypothetical protein
MEGACRRRAWERGERIKYILRYKLPNDQHWHETAPMDSNQVMKKWAELEAEGAYSTRQIPVKKIAS